MDAQSDVERAAIEHDRDLAWELYEFQPTHPRIAPLARSVLARVPAFTGMVILLALHYEALGDVDEARQLLRGLIAMNDRQYLNALRKLRDLEERAENYPETLRLSEAVLRGDPEPGWRDLMDHSTATFFVVGPEAGWDIIDAAVELCGRTAPDDYPDALGQRAVRLLATGAAPERFAPAAQEAMDADPSDPFIATALGFAQLYEYRPERAEQLFRRVLSEDPTNEIAQAGMTVTRGFLDPIVRGAATIDDMRAGGMGELAWRMLRDQIFGTDVASALAALDSVMPVDLRASLRAPLSRDEARASQGDAVILAWHDGQLAGSGAHWGADEGLRLLSAAEVGELETAIEERPQEWPQWKPEEEYYTLILTDDAGAYAFEGYGGRLIRRAVDSEDRTIAPSMSDWLWDRVVAFGGHDPRPGRR